ncbi:hypothetical protein [Mucilaginibacter sp. SP1R1]|uniref:hypothetical protein n=1 Tax=Mucilaginibacter sp. SP1R1 TaxID=2723091 RepID=UPI00161D11C0|nr:hypothetical protein [Mucilaginibacter sp. SP1R1]MBB6151565.1 hypothetical protein [Mucilaginibacter sp. SP1R1]
MNIKQALFAALLFGIAMSVVFALKNGFEIGLVTGLFCGALFGLGLYLFSNSGMVKRQTAIGPEVLFPGEQIIVGVPANLVVKPKEFGLKQFAFDQFLWTVGMKDKEALGGRVYVTNYRIIFKSHRLNRLVGMISVFLPTVMDAKNTSFFITKKATIKTVITSMDFVLSDVDQFIELIKIQKDQLTEQDLHNMQQYIIEYPNKCSDGLVAWQAINTVNNLLVFNDKVQEKIEYFTDPLAALGGLLMKEFIDKNIAERWQKNFDSPL